MQAISLPAIAIATAEKWPSTMVATVEVVMQKGPSQARPRQLQLSCIISVNHREFGPRVLNWNAAGRATKSLTYAHLALDYSRKMTAKAKMLIYRPTIPYQGLWTYFPKFQLAGNVMPRCGKYSHNSHKIIENLNKVLCTNSHFYALSLYFQVHAAFVFLFGRHSQSIWPQVFTLFMLLPLSQPLR